MARESSFGFLETSIIKVQVVVLQRVPLNPREFGQGRL
jgi:hypothetical protein